MTMSRKDYVAVAKVLAGDLATAGTDGERMKVRAIALSLADVYRRDNARFDRARFYVASGLGPAGELVQ